MRSGTIFESQNKAITEVQVSNILNVARPVGTWMKRVGMGMVALAVFGVYWVYEPLLREEVRYKSQEPSINNQIINNNQITISKISREYKIYIPKIGAEAKVIANIDPFDKSAYSKALLDGVAEAKGLSHPGSLGTTYLFAHSVGNRIDFARYNAVFYLLDKLENKDQIYIDYNGENYKYEVINKEILGAKDLKYFENQKEEEKLILQTCYPPGTSWKRLVVVARPAIDR